MITLLPHPGLDAAAVYFDVTTGATAVGSSSNHPVNETPQAALDGGFLTRYLNFDKINTGITVSGANPAITVTRLLLETANDAPERDPASYVLEGSNNGSGWTSISSGPLALPLEAIWCRKPAPACSDC